MASSHLHDVLIAKLETRMPLGEGDRAAIRAFALTARTIPPQTYLVREGALPVSCAFLISGFAVRHKITVDGARQIVGMIIPGDFSDLQHLLLKEADHNVQSLSHVEVAETSVLAMQDLILARPAIGQALWIDGLVEASITREWVVNVGRRDGPERIAHLICEIDARLTAAGSVDRDVNIPMTQEQIADATGLTAVHVSRSLKQLESEGLVARIRRKLRVADWDGLQRRAAFNPRYLHLDQARPDTKRR